MDSLSGTSSTPFLEISLVNSTVEKGDFFEIRAERFSPEISDASFQEYTCGLLPSSGGLSPFTRWVKAPLHSMVLGANIPETYQGRVKIRDKTVMKIESARFTDEGETFYCMLSYLNQTTFNLIDIRKNVELDPFMVSASIPYFQSFRFSL